MGEANKRYNILDEARALLEGKKECKAPFFERCANFGEALDEKYKNSLTKPTTCLHKLYRFYSDLDLNNLQVGVGIVATGMAMVVGGAVIHNPYLFMAGIFTFFGATLLIGLQPNKSHD
ncbi:MAG: hypothetical protein Q7R97_02135 [Candidatus Daviesbacteria bacterium]|nr:hypothetical protein [Candidatus Daviesbacteria bacterium]